MSVGFLCAVFALSFYRAATQSFTIDESFTFLRFVEVPFRDALSTYNANNHVLLTLLMKGCRWLLGKSELVLRIPALLGCALFLSASYAIVSASIERPWLRPVTLAALTLNPLVLDHLVAARGYGLALGLSWWALYLAWSDLFLEKPRRLWLAGVCAGLAIAANLVFVIPLGILGLLLIPEYAKRHRFWQLIDGYAGPSLVIAFVLLFLPLSKIQGNEFYFGVAKLSETTASLLGESVWQPFGGLLWIDWLSTLAPSAREFFVEKAAPAALMGMIAALIWMSRKDRTPRTILLAFVVVMVVLSLGTWIAMNKYLGVLFPLTRTGLYVLPMIGFAWALMADVSSSRLGSFGFGSIAVVLTLLYVSELRTSYFSEWRSEAGMKRLVKSLIDDAQSRQFGRPVTAGSSWDLEYSLAYYRVRYRVGWLRVLGGEERKVETPDYFILGRDDQGLIQQLGLKVIEKDDVSGTVLARRS